MLRIPGAWFAALLFGIHPVNVASVVWIAELKNTLSGVLFFGCVAAFLRSDEHKNKTFYVLSIVLFALASLSKGAVVAAPVALGGLLWKNRRLRPNDLLQLAPFVIIGAVVSLVTIRYQSQAPDYGLVSSQLLKLVAIDEYDKAATCFRRALRLNPADVSA